MYSIIINGYLILFLAFISALFSTRFKYYYYYLDVNVIRCRADVKAKNSIRNLMMMMTRDVIGHCDWIEERILCCEKMVRYFTDDDDTDNDDNDNQKLHAAYDKLLKCVF